MIYHEVHFLIDSAYVSSTGWPSQEEKESFRIEAVELFVANGWTLLRKKYSKASDTVRKGQMQLYLHPKNFTGLLPVSEIPTVEHILQSAKTFRYRTTSLFKEYTDMGDEAYLTYLHGRRDEIVEAILKKYQTKKQDVFICASLVELIASPFIIHRVADRDNPNNEAFAYVQKLTEELISEGRLIQGNTKYGPGIRTATKKDLKSTSK